MMIRRPIAIWAKSVAASRASRRSASSCAGCGTRSRPRGSRSRGLHRAARVCLPDPP
jgi:hypothetical protein